MFIRCGKGRGREGAGGAGRCMGRGSDANPVAQRFAHGRWGGGQRTSGVRFAGSFGSFVLGGVGSSSQNGNGRKVTAAKREKQSKENKMTRTAKKGKKWNTPGARLPRPAFPALSSQRQACRHTRERCTERKRDKTDWQRKKINLKNGEKYEMADLGQKVLWRRRRHHRQKRRRLR